MKRYKPYFVKFDPYSKQLNMLRSATSQGYEICFKRIHSLEESVIRTEKYAYQIKEWFEYVLFELRNTNFIVTSDLTKVLSNYFDPYGIQFIFKGNNIASDGSGIGGMQSGNKTYVIQVLCDHNFKQNVKTQSKLLIQTFYDLIVHELTHRGQFLLRNIYRMETEKYTSPRENFKKYLSQKSELMAYANQAIEELRFEGLSDKEIIIKLKSFDFKETRSATLLNYMSTFNKNDPSDYKIFKQLIKYMIEYLTGERKRYFE